jgi:hypothetical protein
LDIFAARPCQHEPLLFIWLLFSEEKSSDNIAFDTSSSDPISLIST